MNGVRAGGGNEPPTTAQRFSGPPQRSDSEQDRH